MLFETRLKPPYPKNRAKRGLKPVPLDIYSTNIIKHTEEEVFRLAYCWTERELDSYIGYGTIPIINRESRIAYCWKGKDD